METTLVPIVGMFFAICVPLLIPIVYFYFQFQKRRLISEERKLAIEKGIEIPSEPLAKPKKQKTPLQSLKNGLVLLGIGLALLISYLISFEEGLEIAGLILSFMGIGFIVWYKIAKNEEKKKIDLIPNDNETL